MNDNKLETLLMKLKAIVKQSSGKIREEDLLNMINLIARTEMELKQNSSICAEKYEKEIVKFISDEKFTEEKSIKK